MSESSVLVIHKLIFSQPAIVMRSLYSTYLISLIRENITKLHHDRCVTFFFLSFERLYKLQVLVFLQVKFSWRSN